MAGAEGLPTWAMISTFVEAGDIHPAAFVAVKEYVPAARPEIVVLVPEPVIAPGLIVQLPAGKPLSTILPVDDEQLGWVMIPVNGAEGVDG